MRKKACVLLSGGLDSVVSAYYTKKYKADIDFCLFFDYGQKALKRERKAAEFFSKELDARLITVKLPFLREITGTALVNSHSVPNVNMENLDDIQVTTQSMIDVWVPNRNGLFLNVAASYADSFKTDYIVVGFNKEEAVTFKDNSIEFIKISNKAFKLSTLFQPEIYSPYYGKDKDFIVKSASRLKVPLEKIYSCYNGYSKMCGVCESCIRFKRALGNNDISFSRFFEI